MAHYVTRQWVNNRLSLGKSASYKLVPRSYLALISTDDILKVLNRCRRGREQELDYVPSDIVTPERAEAETGIPARRLLMWSRRKVRIPPHFHFSNKAIRFRLSSLKSWMENRARG